MIGLDKLEGVDLAPGRYRLVLGHPYGASGRAIISRLIDIRKRVFRGIAKRQWEYKNTRFTIDDVEVDDESLNIRLTVLGSPAVVIIIGVLVVLGIFSLSLAFKELKYIVGGGAVGGGGIPSALGGVSTVLFWGVVALVVWAVFVKGVFRKG